MVHRLLLAVGQKGALGAADPAVPGEEFRLVGVGGKAVDGFGGRRRIPQDRPVGVAQVA